jgi:hypothetical protein
MFDLKKELEHLGFSDTDFTAILQNRDDPDAAIYAEIYDHDSLGQVILINENTLVSSYDTVVYLQSQWPSENVNYGCWAEEDTTPNILA